ncbi:MULTISPECIES: DUF6879 family protein [unclassified Streptomyces]|uniref:DUF6879 family protein n=1 Tax=unclassified Streptomyces TaxID=2593676 RepID=UPI000DC777C0|nr:MULTISPECIES: DUF6879 family protein [unclassified Streptomyces]AWZ05123.1 hypothetical protein DRB89_11185 [Streptomyces sp. ICC4]AWZ12616.1 hypothetical protein DRB96_10110 [Streptomyces sp. ICC1]
MKPSSVPPFGELIAGCQRSAVHLELRDSYGIASEDEDFAMWRELGGISPESVESRRPWLDLVKEAVGRGVVMRRARIVSVPVSAYIRYEHAGTYLNVGAGELIRWLPRPEAATLALPGADFWLFDDRLIRFGHFSGDGSFVGHELNDDPEVVKMCADAFESVWDRSTPHEEFTV